MIVFINIALIFLILFVGYWFFFYKSSKVDQSNQGDWIEIIVDNGVYDPAVIKSALGKPLQLRFIRRTNSACAETVVFSGINQSAVLPYNKPLDMEINIDKAGIYEFTCDMGMYRGKIIVEWNDFVILHCAKHGEGSDFVVLNIAKQYEGSPEVGSKLATELP